MREGWQLEGILYALMPAIAWGSLVLVSEKLGGDSYSQTLGITAGSFLFAVVMYFINQPEMGAVVWIIGIISGAGWAVGQLYQFNSVKEIGVSKTVPISTGLQLLGTTFFGVVVFKEWEGTMAIVAGLIALACLIAGIILTNIGNKTDEDGGNKKKGALYLAISTAGFVLYVIIVQWYEVGGWEAILPQAVGMLAASLLLSIKSKPFNKYTIRNMLTGVMWAVGNIGLLLANREVGVATGFSISQTGIVISTLGGIFLLGEKKSKKQIWFITAGLLLVITGGVMLGYTKG